MGDAKSPSIADITSSSHNLVQVSTKKRLWERKKRKITAVLLPIFILLTIILFTLFLLFFIQYKKLLNNQTCNSEDCIDTANTFMQIMDFSQDPCKNFYAFACGNFGSAHPLPDGHFTRSWFEEGEDKLTRIVQKLLEGSDTKSTSEAMKKTRMLYKSCLDLDEMEEKGLAPLYDLLSKLELPKYPSPDIADSFNLGKTLGLLQRHLNSDVIVTMGLDKGALSPGAPNNTYIIEVMPRDGKGPPGLRNYDSSIPDLETLRSLLKDFQPSSEAIRKDFSSEDISGLTMTRQQMLMKRILFMATIMDVIIDDLGIVLPETPGNETELIKNSIKILGFTGALNEVVAGMNDTEESTQMTLAELQAVLEDHSPTVHPGNKIQWEDYLAGVFGGENGYWNYDFKNDLVTVTTVDAFRTLATFLANFKPITIMRYIWWVVVRDYAKFTTAEMRQAYTKLEEDLLGTGSASSRERGCVTMIRKYMHLPLAKDIRELFGLASDITKVEEMLNDIQYEFENLASNVNWMDERTKKLNINKSKAMGRYIGYEPELLDTTLVDQHYIELVLTERDYLQNMVALKSWEAKKAFRILKQTNYSVMGVLQDKTNPVQVNAYYARNTNAIYVPAGILQKPFYFRGLEVLNYGAIGSILGHEVTHGFDIDGKDYDKKGQLQEQIWSAKITKQYEHKAQCFVHQYGTFNISKSKRLDGSVTLAENIADNGGLRESYYAYKSFVKRHGTEPKLPGFEGFTHEQLLFLSFATVWCETSTERYQELAAGLDNHSPNRIRVLATLQNMQEFSEAYQCPSGSFMNPKHKCIIW